MKKIYLSVLSIALIGLSHAQDSANVLFIGNSYTGVNNLPLLVFELAEMTVLNLMTLITLITPPLASLGLGQCSP